MSSCVYYQHSKLVGYGFSDVMNQEVLQDEKYRPPEQWGFGFRPERDIWSMGIVLCQLIDQPLSR